MKTLVGGMIGCVVAKMPCRDALGGMALGAMMACVATPVEAQERDYCPERPGLGTPACIIAPGRVSVETALADWTRDDSDGMRSETLLLGDTQVRVGLTDRVEAQVGWSPFVRQYDREAGIVDTARGVGDLRLGMKASLRAPDGAGLSIAVLPYVTVPVGRRPLGNGTWSTGLVVPVTYDLSDRYNVQFTSAVGAAANADGSGRHLAYSGIAGLDIDLSDSVDVETEVSVTRDDEPAEPVTMIAAGLSLGWRLSPDLYLDAGAVAGLNKDTPAVRFYTGIAKRF